MIVSMPMVVLPIARSPMISSRWPRPRANRVSTTVTSPVCTGCTTRSRSMIDGAGRSIGCIDSRLRRWGRLRSSGRPSGSTTRPSSARPDRHAHDVARCRGPRRRPRRRPRRPAARSRSVRAPAPGRSRTGPCRNAAISSSLHVWQARDQGDAIAHFLDPADLPPRAEPSGAPASLLPERVANQASGGLALSSGGMVELLPGSARDRPASCCRRRNASPWSSIPAIRAGSALNSRCGWAPNASGDERARSGPARPGGAAGR